MATSGCDIASEASEIDGSGVSSRSSSDVFRSWRVFFISKGRAGCLVWVSDAWSEDGACPRGEMKPCQVARSKNGPASGWK